MRLGFFTGLSEEVGFINAGVVGLPVATITTDSTDPTADSPIFFTIRWSEAISTDFIDDFVIGNGTHVGTAIHDYDYYIIEVDPDGAGDVTVDLPAGVCWDNSGNPNVAVDTFTIEYAP